MREKSRAYRSLNFLQLYTEVIYVYFNFFLRATQFTLLKLIQRGPLISRMCAYTLLLNANINKLIYSTGCLQTFPLLIKVQICIRVDSLMLMKSSYTWPLKYVKFDNSFLPI